MGGALYETGERKTKGGKKGGEEWGNEGGEGWENEGGASPEPPEHGPVTPFPLFSALLNDGSPWSLHVCVLSWP